MSTVAGVLKMCTFNPGIEKKVYFCFVVNKMIFYEKVVYLLVFMVSVGILTRAEDGLFYGKQPNGRPPTYTAME